MYVYIKYIKTKLIPTKAYYENIVNIVNTNLHG